MASYEKILLVDDEKGLLDLLTATLRREHYTDLSTASTAAEALNMVKENEYDLILLDVNLPDFSGFELCQEIRRHSYTPIIFLTAMDSDFDKLQGLTIGGDDYITKPFNPMEVVARVKAMLRRQGYTAKSAPAPVSERYAFDYFELDTGSGTLTVNGEPVEATAKELALLRHFCENPGRVFSAGQLYEAVWGEPGYGEDKTVSMHISRLRKKLGIEEKDEGIINLRGIGYKFLPPKKG